MGRTIACCSVSYIHTHVFTAKYGRNTHDNFSSYFCNHMVVAGICNYISLVPILYYLDLEQEPQLITVFLPAERPVPSILKGLDDYSYFFNKKFYKVNKAHRKAETYLHPIHI